MDILGSHGELGDLGNHVNLIHKKHLQRLVHSVHMNATIYYAQVLENAQNYDVDLPK